MRTSKYPLMSDDLGSIPVFFFLSLSLSLLSHDVYGICNLSTSPTSSQSVSEFHSFKESPELTILGRFFIVLA